MISLLNKFIIVGSLKECRIDWFPSHIRAEFNIGINNDFDISVHYFINRKFYPEKYKEFVDLIPYIHPEINGWIWVNKEKYYCVTSQCSKDKIPTKLFLSGNILEKNNKIYFNCEYLKKTNNLECINISLEGIYTNNGFLNVVNNSPRIFNVPLKQKNKKNEIVVIELIYNSYCKKNKENIFDFNNYNYNFNVKTITETKKFFDQKDIDNYLLEWEIINKED